MKMLLLATLSLTGATLAQAAPVEVFNADTQCASRMTGTGERFVPPCQFSSHNMTADRNTAYSSDGLVRNGSFKTILNYNFVCESLRPLSVRYTLSAGSDASETNRIAGSRIDEINTLSMVHGNHDADLVFNGLDGVLGFQAIKPGCQLNVNQLLTYPEPSYFGQLASHLVTHNGVIKSLVSIAQPSTNSVQLISSIDNTLDLLSNLTFDIEDPIFLDQITTAQADLERSKAVFTNNCRAGSSSSLCTVELARLRQVLQGNLSWNEAGIRSLHTYLSEQTRWLSGQSIGRDALVLTNAVNRLRSRL
ncbi:hypothetical protein [Pseudoalteromonas sp. MMG012]|uniref:hypothetical protein n=1 Tax=Pseudoalteromonas sp. MMG012 TaxID=2822686 RepID=UPI001B39F806|nr:hypothetical protein [Pseudoalteromonas sp. MMG012]MBQ4850571.1 hypothetical protein [Pseudoalteromonas sp. MMG012]